MDEKPSLFGQVLQFILVLIAGLVFSWFAGKEFLDYLASSQWQSAEASISRLDVEVDDSSDSVQYLPIVAYQFAVNGQSYQGSRYHFGANISSDSQSRAEEIIQQYQLGQRVIVYFNPASPESSVLKRELDLLLWLFLAIGLGCLLVAIVMLIQAVLSLRTHQKKKGGENA